MAEHVVVGSEEIPVRKVVGILRKSDTFQQFSERWRDLSFSLHLPVEKIKKLKQDLNLEKSTLIEITNEIISAWVSQEGSNATLDTLNNALIENNLKDPAEHLLRAYVGIAAGENYKKYCRIPVQIKNFISSEQTLGGVENICIVRTLDVNITCQKIKENVERAYFHKYLGFLKLASLAHNSLGGTHVITDINNKAKLCRCVTEIHKGEVLIKGKLMVVIQQDCYNEVKEELEKGPLTICSDKMQWGDLSPAFKEIIRQKLEEIVTIDRDNEDALFDGEALVSLIKENHSYLPRSHLPELESFYVNRTLIARNVLNAELLFRDKSSDVFVFKEASKFELTTYVAVDKIENSSEQLKQITSKFIILDNVNHISQLQLLSNSPLHLIEYDNGRFIFRKATRSIKTVQNLVSRSQPSLVFYLEGDFLKLLLNSNDNFPICISEGPGTGKSFLLISLGKTLEKIYPKRRIYFLAMSRFIINVKYYRQLAIDLQEAIQLSLTNLICDNKLEEAMLLSQLGSNSTNVELLLDGLDEVNPSLVKLALDTIIVIKSWPSTRLWISTRPSLLHVVEEALGSLGYNIRRFTKEDQTSLLKSHWKSSPQQNMEELEDTKITQFAQECLTSLKKSITENEQDILGTPLQCHLLAQVYAEEAFQYCSNERSDDTVPPIQINQLSDLYTQLMDNKYEIYKQKNSGSNQMTKDEMLQLHAMLALRLIFPNHFNFLSKHLPPIVTLDASRSCSTQTNATGSYTTDIQNFGILKNCSTSMHPVFLHRTFADFFAAWYVVNLISKTECDEGMGLFIRELLKYDEINIDVLVEEFQVMSAAFVQPNVLYFLDSLSATSSLSRNLGLALSIPTELSFQEIVKACAHNRFISLAKVLIKCEKFHTLPPSFYEEFVLLSARYSNVDFLRLSMDLFRKQGMEFNLASMTKALRLTVIGGNLPGFNHLIQLDDYRKLIEETSKSTYNLLNDSVKNSSNDSPSIISNRKQIISALLLINRKLLETKDVNGKTSILCDSMHPDIFEQLIKEGANADAQDRDHNTVLHLIRPSLQYHQILECIHLIDPLKLQKLVRMKNKNSETPLQTLLQHQDPLQKTFLLFKNHNADFNVINRTYDSLLSSSIKSGRNTDSICQLVQCGADTTWKTWIVKRNLLHIAARYGNLNVMKYFVRDHKMSLNSRDWSWNSPMDYVLAFFRNKRIEGVTESSILQLFEETNPKQLNFQISREERLRQAISNSDLRELQTLLKCDINLNHVTVEGDTPLQLAAKIGADDIVTILIKSHADVNFQNNAGAAPLHSAAIRGKDSTVKLLIELGANANLKDETGAVPLHWAAKTGNDSAVNCLIDRGALINLQDRDGLTPLHVAAQKGKDSTVKSLVDRGASVNVQNQDGSIPIHFAAAFCKDVTVEFLINEGADVKFQNKDGSTPLHWAVSSGKDSSVKSLIDHGAFVNVQNHDGDSPLHSAARMGHTSIVNSLVDFGANVDVQNKFGRTPLHLAARMEHCSTAMSLGDLGVNVNHQDSNGFTALHWAASDGKDLIAKSLIDLGADVNLQDKDGSTPLHYAARGEKHSMVKSLINFGANVNIQDKDGWASLHYAAYWENDSTVKSLIDLEAKVNNVQCNDGSNFPQYYAIREENELMVIPSDDLGANFNTKDNDGLTPLHFATQEGQDSTVQSLIRYGANVNLKDEDGSTPTLTAAEEGKDSTVKCLIEQGANVNLQNNDGWTALHRAAEEGNDSTVKCLIDHGADLNVQNKNGSTALYGTAKEGKDWTVKCLIDHGANVNLQNKDGLTALHLAAKYGKDSTAKLLTDHGANVNLQDTDGWTALHLAAQEGEDSTVKSLIELGANVNFQNNNGWTALHCAANIGKDSTVKSLIDGGASLNLQDTDEWTALYCAAKDRKDSTVKLLIDLGADVNLQNNDGSTALHLAAQEGKDSSVKLLIDLGANVNLQNNRGSTALHWAAGNGKDSTVKCLIDHGANVNLQGNDGFTALHWATREGRDATVKLLIEHGANVNLQNTYYRWTALHWAVKEGNDSTVKCLIDLGASVNLQNENGWTALHWAANEGNDLMVKCLIDHGADVNHQDKDGLTALHWAAREAKDSTVKCLIDLGANINLHSRNGLTAMHLAAKHGNDSTVKCLIDHGANVNLQNKNGWTALHWAAYGGKDSTVKLLIDHGANVNLQNKDGSTALHWAAEEGNDSTLKLLVDLGANVNLQNRDDWTPLHWAAQTGNDSTVKLLVELGANVNLQSKYGSTALHWAAGEGKDSTVKCLIDHGANVNFRDNAGKTPLCRALEEKKSSTVDLLTKHGGTQ